MRLFTKSWICIAWTLHPGIVHFKFLDGLPSFLLVVFPRGWFRGAPFRSPLQGGLKGLGARGGGDEGLKVEGGFTFGRLQGGFKGASRGLQGGFKGASP